MLPLRPATAADTELILDLIRELADFEELRREVGIELEQRSYPLLSQPGRASHAGLDRSACLR